MPWGRSHGLDSRAQGFGLRRRSPHFESLDEVPASHRRRQAKANIAARRRVNATISRQWGELFQGASFRAASSSRFGRSASAQPRFGCGAGLEHLGACSRSCRRPRPAVGALSQQPCMARASMRLGFWGFWGQLPIGPSNGRAPDKGVRAHFATFGGSWRRVPSWGV